MKEIIISRLILLLAILQNVGFCKFFCKNTELFSACGWKKIVFAVTSLFIIIFLQNCGTISYKVIRKQNMFNTEIYREVNEKNYFFIFGLFPFHKKNYTNYICKNNENSNQFEISSSTKESYPSVLKTRYSVSTSFFNLALGILIMRRDIYVYCPYD